QLDYIRKKKWKLKALSATSIAGGFLVFLYEKNWLEAIIKERVELEIANNRLSELFSESLFL
ncbi:hypothetical protein JO387_08665, partial [Streptococcus suis]|nr:hypothetical protein [Streptococcus suis]MBM7319277.1 hypothetical protein [Streptococcus suis]